MRFGSLTSPEVTASSSGVKLTAVGADRRRDLGFNSGSIAKFNGTTATTVSHASSTRSTGDRPPARNSGPITVTKYDIPDRNCYQPKQLHGHLSQSKGVDGRSSLPPGDRKQ